MEHLMKLIWGLILFGGISATFFSFSGTPTENSISHLLGVLLPSYVIRQTAEWTATANLYLIAGQTCNLVMRVGILRQLFTKPISYFSCCLLHSNPHAQLSHSVFQSSLSHTNTHGTGRANAQHKGTNRGSLPPNTVFFHFST